MDHNQYLELFIDESKEHLQAINENLLLLESQPNEINIVKEIFRAAHTLKGMSSTMQFNDMASLTHKMENVLDLIRNEKIKVNNHIMDVLFKCIDLLETMLQDIIDGGNGKKEVNEVLEQLHEVETGSKKVKQENESNETINYILSENENLLLQEHKRNGRSIFDISLNVKNDCIMKSARVFMVFANLEDIGEIINITPNKEEIKVNEDFDGKCKIIFATNRTKADIEESILEISEIESYSISNNNFKINYSKDNDEKEFVIKVNIDNQSVMKSARAYIAINELNQVSKIIDYTPSLEDIKGDNFQGQFSVQVFTKKSLSEINQLLSSLVEVHSVEITEVNNVKQNQVTIVENKPTVNTNKVKSGKSIRVDIEKLDILMNLFSELVIDRGRLDKISKDNRINDLTDTVDHMSRISNDLQNIVLSMRMIPIDTVFNRFPRMIRDLSRELNKNVQLHIIGADTELDKTIVEELSDPLMHLIRNAIDHGLESNEDRKNTTKPENGSITLRAYHSGNNIFIEVEDDGKGIDRNKVLNKAIKNNLIDSQKAKTLSDKEVYSLLFASGLSTAETISDISGRGVGLDVVKSKIEELGGTVYIESTLGIGSKFIIELPLTLSIINALLVQTGNETYAIPLNSIIETLALKEEDIQKVHGKEVINFRGKITPLLYTSNLFKIDKNKSEEELFVVIIKKGEKSVALVVDAFIGQQEIVLKEIGKYLNGVFGISGATILGNGEVTLILDTNALII